MNNVDILNAPPATVEIAPPSITRRFGRTTCQVYVHFSETSKETINDKIERLISSEIQRIEMVQQ